MLRSRRDGITLVEVLVTIFIMGIGLLAILTLFPLAALNMVRAVRDDRSGQCAQSMDGFFRAYWKEIVETQGASDPALFNAFDDPDGPNGIPGFPNLPPAGPFEPSYPVVIDPWGYLARPNTANPNTLPDRIGDGNATFATYVPRRTMAMFVPPRTPPGLTTPYILSALSLKDTVGYDADLRLTPDREYRHNAMAVAHRPLNINRYAANLTIVVFDNRPLLFGPAGSEAVFANTTFTPGATAITVNHAANAGPNLRRGNWVMDASVNPVQPVGLPARFLIRHAFFYQVVSITPVSTTQTVLELQTPIRTPTDNNMAAYNGTLIVLDGVSGVYQRRPLAAGE